MSGDRAPGDRRLLEFEFDQFQRYSFVRRVLDAAYEERRRQNPIRVLDVGSGPQRLTETFLSSGFAVTRADIESFGDDAIVVIPSTGSLPFETRAFDVVVALEVVEHVAPGDRGRLIGECLRVAKDLVVLSCPDGRPEVAAAEARVAAAFEFLTGDQHPFLTEHAEWGLPTEKEIRRLLDETGFPYAVSANVPLDRWEAVLMLDQLLRTVEQGPEIAKSIYRRANTEPETRGPLAYRKVYVVSKQPTLAPATRPIPEDEDPVSAPELRAAVFQLARLAAAELSDRELERLRSKQAATAAAEAARVARLGEERARQNAAEAEERASAGEQRLARISPDVERLASTLAAAAAGDRRYARVIAAPRRLVEPAWTNQPYAAEPSASVENVRAGGHSIWCFSGRGWVTLRADLAPGHYRLRTHAASSADACVIVELASSTSTGRVPGRLGPVAIDLSLDEDVHELRVRVDPATPAAALIDLEILKRIEEPVAMRVRRNAIDGAKRRRYLLRLASTPLGRAVARRVARPTPAVSPERAEYERWIQERLAGRPSLYPAPRKRVPLSILTTVWNTPPAFLADLARSVLTQSYDDFEWIVLDNGSTDAETITCLRQFVGDDRVRFERVEENIGIVGGMRHCLERATGRYVLPVDSDDRLYLDALAVFASALAAADLPAIGYSDEDKLFADRFLDAYLKPGWDPVLFLNSCYIAHLCAIDRKRALELGVYSDDAAEGCHDWDTFIRFMLAGERPTHVGEVLYSWRMHPQSAALNIGSKSYLDASHVHVLRKFLDASARPELYEVVRSPLWGPTPDWWFRRARRDARPIHTVWLGSSTREPKSLGSTHEVALDAGAAALEPLAEQAEAAGALINLVWSEIDADDEGCWDALALFELHRDTVVVGGRVLDGDRRIVAAGEFFGFGGICASPDIGRLEHDPGYFGQMWKQRSVSAVSTMLAFVEPSFLLESLHGLDGDPVSLPFLGSWLGAVAASTGRRVVYTPFVLGTTRASRHEWDALVSEDERRAFAKRFVDLVPERRFLSQLLSLDPARPYTPSSKEDREEDLARLSIGPTRREPLAAART